MNVGERIKQRRLELNLSQDELAKKVGYKSRSSINKIELSRSLPLSKVEKMAKALETTPADLMGWDENEKDFTPDDASSYYLNDEARELAEFLYDNPNYKVLFDASRKVKPEDIEFVKQMIERMGGLDG